MTQFKSFVQNLAIPNGNVGNTLQVGENGEIVFVDPAAQYTGTDTGGVLWNHDLAEENAMFILPDLTRYINPTVVIVKRQPVSSSRVIVNVKPAIGDTIMGVNSTSGVYCSDKTDDVYATVTFRAIGRDWVVMEGVGSWQHNATPSQELENVQPTQATVQLLGLGEDDGAHTGSVSGDFEYRRVTAMDPVVALSAYTSTNGHDSTKRYIVKDFVGPGINVNNVRGVYIKLRRLGNGRVTSTETTCITITYPNGEARKVLGTNLVNNVHEYFHDYTILVPINRGQEYFDIRMYMFDGGGDRGGIGFSVFGVQQCINTSIDASFSTFWMQSQCETTKHYIGRDVAMQGTHAYTVPSSTAKFVNYVDSNGVTEKLLGTKTGRSVMPFVNVFPSSISDVEAPLYRPPGCFKTEIVATLLKNDGTSSNETGSFSFMIDWLEQTYSGTFNVRTENRIQANIWTNVPCDGMPRSYTATSVEGNLSWDGSTFGKTGAPIMEVQPYGVTKLPVWRYGDLSESAVIQLRVKHYNTTSTQEGGTRVILREEFNDLTPWADITENSPSVSLTPVQYVGYDDTAELSLFPDIHRTGRHTFQFPMGLHAIKPWFNMNIIAPKTGNLNCKVKFPIRITQNEPVRGAFVSRRDPSGTDPAEIIRNVFLINGNGVGSSEGDFLEIEWSEHVFISQQYEYQVTFYLSEANGASDNDSNSGINTCDADAGKAINQGYPSGTDILTLTDGTRTYRTSENHAVEIFNDTTDYSDGKHPRLSKCYIEATII